MYLNRYVDEYVSRDKFCSTHLKTSENQVFRRYRKRSIEKDQCHEMG